jgi:hypothetical protein
MRLIDLQDFKIVIASEALAIYPFSELWKRDKTKDKSVAFNDITYVWYMTDYDSPYFAYEDKKKEEHIKKDIIKDEKYKPDALVKTACEEYKKFAITPAMEMLTATNSAITATKEYLNNVDYKLKDAKGNFLYTIESVQNCVIKMPKMIAAYNESLELCKKSQTSGVKVRGDKDVGIYE